MPDSSPSAPAEAEIAALRAEIDAIDDAMHDLLMRRAAVVARMAGSRAKGNTTPLRAGREAAVLRRLLARHAGPLARARIVRIWREIFMASTAIQGGFSAAVFAPDPQSGHARLARQHFGPLTPTRVHPTPARALAAVTGGEASAAVLPAPIDGEPAADAWWARLDVPRLQVVARLPFLAGPASDPGALVVAPVAPDPCGEDRSLLMVEAEAGAQRGRIAQALSGAGFAVTSLILSRAPAATLALAEVEGFLRAEDPRLASLPWARRIILGAYAAPVPGDAP
ncbi:chorismate mutase [Neoroseomonas oryzicola]|uniref:chorismate mutase n=1 Tax=Neoroseomonas oryzicola TaxID=535904 RepID=A0A9X9WFQ3_9PROT|nr:chorismate mutase [Neoroseomonas oryzicola]MBR0659163.1 chorismate mutase [Neoroseomonas oryzicola]NKE17735.1 chorismate mutase [Neoroseomonas oryzicola]